MSDNWKKERVTQKQLDYISDIIERSIYPIDPFYGTTKEEAAKWIDKYAGKTLSSSWAIEHGYF